MDQSLTGLFRQSNQRNKRGAGVQRNLPTLEEVDDMFLVGGSYKLDERVGPDDRLDMRNSYHMFMFVSKCRYNIFGKQKTIDACVESCRSLEAHWFEFREMGFAGNHVHFLANVPKRYFVLDAEIVFKSRSSRNMFARYPASGSAIRGSFWSGYEHHESIDRDMEQAAAYIRSQLEHHGFAASGVQKSVFDFN